MNKNVLQKFAIEARRELIEKIKNLPAHSYRWAGFASHDNLFRRKPDIALDLRKFRTKPSNEG